ncbi:hypothetical protein ARMSODRAFT_562840 [Armillaria solidipes]|uniref:Uncharacterized protein n=1 Tax=Armillaria solidipes TaxID=1076256 RepID=A0A2H3BST0_9AGAR|nr:hypothetical protein ARMSODRAFT_562840 [Armillaria solidipes]
MESREQQFLGAGALVGGTEAFCSGIPHRSCDRRCIQRVLHSWRFFSAQLLSPIRGRSSAMRRTIKPGYNVREKGGQETPMAAFGYGRRFVY